MPATDENNKALGTTNPVKGWAIDADTENDPTYPMKNFTGDDHLRLSYQKPFPQAVTTEILHSNERPGVTSVFGTSQPPAGLSGMLRRFAFRYSEGSWGHWLPLLLADRINVIEGVVDDLKQGNVPNMFAEGGWKAEWKYNRKGAIRKIVIRTAVVSAIAALIIYKVKKK
jgi:hypothetical protein